MTICRAGRLIRQALEYAHRTKTTLQQQARSGGECEQLDAAPREANSKDLDGPADNSLGRSHLEHWSLAIMQINSIPTVAPVAAGKASTATTNPGKPKSATSTPATTGGAPAAASASSAVAKSTTATPSAASSTSAQSKPASGQAAPPTQSVAAAVSTATSTLASSTYSTSVGGKSYSASISQANGTYTLSVPNLPGARVSGSGRYGSLFGLPRSAKRWDRDHSLQPGSPVPLVGGNASD